MKTLISVLSTNYMPKAQGVSSVRNELNSYNLMVSMFILYSQKTDRTECEVRLLFGRHSYYASALNQASKWFRRDN
jgi:hypothetical protein